MEQILFMDLSTQHDPGHFDIALELARYVAE